MPGDQAHGPERAGVRLSGRKNTPAPGAGAIIKALLLWT